MTTSNKHLYDLKQGSLPLLVSIPHCGNYIPDAIKSRLTPEAQTQPDADWHLQRLYTFVAEMGGSLLTATHSRYVIDLNRPPDDESLYPGQTTTGLCPRETFRGDPVYIDGRGVDPDEMADRRHMYWEPYHDALQNELTRLRKLHKHVLLWEGHSIASVLPRLFDGRLPDLNFGTLGGKTCTPLIQEEIERKVKGERYSWVFNGRFKGGYITRHYGTPQDGIHAVQLEMAQEIYMSERFPYSYDAALAAGLVPVLKEFVQQSLDVLLKL